MSRDGRSTRPRRERRLIPITHPVTGETVYASARVMSNITDEQEQLIARVMQTAFAQEIAKQNATGDANGEA